MLQGVASALTALQARIQAIGRPAQPDKIIMIIVDVQTFTQPVNLPIFNYAPTD
jgi:hypothetical protein